MAAELVGGAFLSAFLQVLFDRLASHKVIDFFKGRKLDSELLEKLKIKMTSVEGLLDDAEEKQITRRAVRKWLDDLKDAFYEADDFLDEIVYAALSLEMESRPQTSRGGVWKFFSSQDPLQKIESKLLKILKKLEYLVDQKSHLDLKEGIGEKLSSQKVQTSSVMDESEVYGRQKDKEVIIQLLLSDDANCNNLGLIPIVGMGGIGKTTLAQLVYNDSRVEEQFDFKAWIYVSEEFDVLKVTRNILNVVSSIMHNFETLDQFQVELKNQLADKKFLLVLDDVWNYDYERWDILLRPLKAGIKGSKIIITTRLQSVASVMEVIHTHHLKEISEEECWVLFSKHAFHGRSSSTYPKLEEISREIAKKCDGLPLAAKSLGGLLRSKRKPKEWERVLKNDIWNLPKDNIIPALRLSYHFLPSPLKQCFAYCAIFPKGYRFKKEELVLLWMGEGFLGQAGFNMEREVIGEEYFDDLVSRSFFNPNGDVFEPGFIMHDLINDLARSVTGEFCFRLDDDDDSCKVTPRTRHLSYVPRKSLLPNKSETITSAPLLRTFLLRRAYHNIDEKVIYDILPKLECLRVLSLFLYGNVLKLDDSISNLKHLRYLDLSGASFKILPESLCSLYHLEILLLVDCDELIELPLHLKILANLCVLDVKRTPLQKMPPQMGKLTKLQKLSDFVIGKKSGSSIQELGYLQQLRGGLVIKNLQNVMDVEEALRANIKGKIHLKEMELVWEGDVDDSVQARCLLEQLEPHENVETLTISGYGGTRFPDWIDGGSPLLGVVTLKLDGCRHCCQLPPLGQLAHLKKLLITDFPGIVSIGPEFYGRCTSMTKPFQCLEVLRFENMPQWQEWIVCGNEEEDFHLLKELYIIKCPAFKHTLPQHLPSLTTLKINGCERFMASLPRVPRILEMDLDDLTLSDGYELSAFRSQSPLLERIEQLGCCGLFNTLEEVTILQCDFLKCFSLESFSNLKHLRIMDCPNFETINGNYISLLSLQIRKCPNVVSFPKVEEKTPNLRRLELDDCSNLKCLPESMHSLLYSLEGLVIRKCPKLKSFLKGGLPLKLQRLEIFRCTKLINGRNQWNLYCLPSLLDFVIGGYRYAECFPEESLLPPTLTSLKIWYFPNLKSLEYRGYQHLTSLRCLTIDRCPELQLLPEAGLPSSLTSLKIWDLQNLESVVNSKIQQLTNLKELWISNCPKLKYVPEEGLPSTITSLEISGFDDLESLNSTGLQNLTSLKILSIEGCPKLQSLPKEGLPSSLSYLYIVGCPLLEKRCEREKGEDWPKISHISDLIICKY